MYLQVRPILATPCRSFAKFGATYPTCVQHQKKRYCSKGCKGLNCSRTNSCDNDHDQSSEEDDYLYEMSVRHSRGNPPASPDPMETDGIEDRPLLEPRDIDEKCSYSTAVLREYQRDRNRDS